MIVIKSIEKLGLGVVGSEDIDVVLRGSERINYFCCSNAYPLSHNDRVDMFKIFNGRILHFDGHRQYCVGPKFSKKIRYRELDVALEGLSLIEKVFCRFAKIQTINKTEELKLFLARSVMRNYKPLLYKKHKLPSTIFDEFKGILEDQQKTLRYDAYNTSVTIQVEQNDCYISRSAALKLRKSILEDAGMTEVAYLFLVVSNIFKLSIYVFARKTKLFWVTKRGVKDGLVVAFVAPDGLGKSTIVDLVFNRFNHKFDCYKDYLGTGDGRGFMLRKRIQNKHSENFKRGEVNADQGITREFYSVIRCSYGVLVALEKLIKTKRIFRAKRSNALTFVDRWPHNISRNGMDGPIKPPRRANFLCKLLMRIEDYIYDQICKHDPDLIILLDATHQQSHERKPGEISNHEFERKMKLAKLAFGDRPNYRSIDATQPLSTVTASVMREIGNFLLQR